MYGNNVKVVILCALFFYSMVGANHDNEWLIEGRRMTPIVPRQPTHTAFTQTADHISAKQVGLEDCKITKVPSIRTAPPYKTQSCKV